MFYRALTRLSLIAAMGLLGAGSQAVDTHTYLHAQRLVSIDDRRMNIYCIGSGPPTVIFDAGLGESMLDWRRVQPEIARHTRACSYDRAGMGFSDPGPLPRDADSVVTDLHALLMHAGISPPYVLVGHSIAGLYVRLYADRYPQDVVGLVLIDPSVEYQDNTFGATWSGWERLQTGLLHKWNLCYNAAVLGHLNPGRPEYKECVAGIRPYAVSDPVLIALRRKQFQLASTWNEILSERTALDTTSSAEVRTQQRSYDGMPLIVLTAGNTLGRLPVTKAQRLALFEVWKHMHDRVAALSSGGMNLVVAGSGHFIQLDRPSVVISAIDKIVDQVRRSHYT